VTEASELEAMAMDAVANDYEDFEQIRLTIARTVEWKLPIELYFYRSPLLGRRYVKSSGQ
jgi:hypothetical protein